MSLKNNTSRPLKNSVDMAMEKSGAMISNDRQKLYEKNTEEMKKYFAENEYGAKAYDKEGNEAESFDNIRGEKLRREITEARGKYAKADYEEDKKNSWLRKILGKRIGNVKIDTRQEAQNEYQSKLTEFSDYEISVLKASILSEDDLAIKMEEMIKYFDTDEKNNLYEAHTNARVESWNGKMGGKIMEKAGNFVNWYRKQNVWAKGAVGMALTASGLGVAALGMRAAGGAATGMGVTASLEAKYRQKEQIATSESRKKTVEQLSGKEAEEKFSILMQKLNTEIGLYEGSLKNEKKQALKRKLIGAGVGVFIGSGAMSEMLKEATHLVSETDTFKNVAGAVSNSELVKNTVGFWKEKLGNIFLSDEGYVDSHEPDEGKGYVDEDKPDKGEGKVDSKAGELNIKPKIIASEPDSIKLEVQKGSSLEGTLIKHLKDTGLSSQEAGTKAHQMALAYAKEHHLVNGSYSLIHPGAHIEIADGKITGIDDEKLGYSRPNVETIKSEGTKKIFEIKKDVIDVKHDSSQINEKPNGEPSTSRGIGGEEVADTDIYNYESFSQSIDKLIAEMQGNRDVLVNQYGLKEDIDIQLRMDALENKIAEVNRGGNGRIIKYSPLTINEQSELDAIKKFKVSIIATYSSAVESFLGIVNQENSPILEMNAGKYLEENNQSRIARIFTSIKETATQKEINDISPKENEKIADWYKRVIMFVLRKKLGIE